MRSRYLYNIGAWRNEINKRRKNWEREKKKEEKRIKGRLKAMCTRSQLGIALLMQINFNETHTERVSRGWSLCKILSIYSCCGSTKKPPPHAACKCFPLFFSLTQKIHLFNSAIVCRGFFFFTGASALFILYCLTLIVHSHALRIINSTTHNRVALELTWNVKLLVELILAVNNKKKKSKIYNETSR